MSAGKRQTSPLDEAGLSTLDERVAVPTYDRGEVSVGIAHIGVGGFHRAHQAMYVDRLMNQGLGSEWGICGVGLLPGDEQMRDALTAQDCLYTLLVKGADDTTQPQVVGSIVEYLFAPDDPEVVIERLADPAVRIVSLTITEGGYNLDAVTGEFDEADPDVAHDLQQGAVPTTTFGLVVEAAHRRRERQVAPFTVMSCDNIPGNGDAARRSFVAFATARDPELGAFVEDEIRFPNSMVDRITPATTDDDRTELARDFGIEDRWPVVCEPFEQWVLEDSFSSGRPMLEKAGVQLVDDVEPYEQMKLRLLNASHQALGYLGYLAGYRKVDEVASDPLFEQLLRAYMDDEATPTLPPVPGIDLEAYKAELVERFTNSAVGDTLSRLCAETSDRIPKFLLPVIRHNLDNDGPIDLATAVVAAWARYAEGIDEDGKPIEVVDRLKESLTEAAGRQRDEPLAFLGNRDIFGDLIDDERFTDSYTSALDSLHRDGARATLEELLKGRI